VEVLFTPDERRVRLIRGEAHFSVAKNPRRPFIVQAEQVEAKAVGTAFNVLLAAQAVEVIVTEGRVQVRPPGQLDASAEEPLVTEGQRAVVSLTEPGAKPRITRIDPNKITQLLSWQFRQLDFADAPLAQVVAEFNRDNHRKIVVDDPALETLLIGASLRSDNIEGFVRMLETSFHVTAERRDDGVIVLRRAPASELR
jgi:transmembrane sensor